MMPDFTTEQEAGLANLNTLLVSLYKENLVAVPDVYALDKFEKFAKEDEERVREIERQNEMERQQEAARRREIEQLKAMGMQMS